MRSVHETNYILEKMFRELEQADEKYKDDPMSVDEILASFKTIEVELKELEREISRKTIRTKALQKEAIQVLAMAFKFNRDVATKL